MPPSQRPRRPKTGTLATFVIRVPIEQKQRALLNARLTVGLSLTEVLRQQIWRLAEAQPALPGMPKVGIVPEARRIAERVHQAHYDAGLDDDWQRCTERTCSVLRRELGLS